jgi:pilus assembly protein CpaF
MLSRTRIQPSVITAQEQKAEPVRPVAEPLRNTLRDFKTRVQTKLVAELDLDMDLSDAERVRNSIETMYASILEEENVVLNRTERARILEWIIAEILGYGPIQSLLEDDTVTEVMVNGPKSIYIERKGRITKTDLFFDSDDHLMQVIDRIVAPIGRRIDEGSPMVDARLPDGSRVNAIIPPLSLVGPCLTIRKFARVPYTVDDLVSFGTLTPELVEFLKACVEARLNMIISGGTGSGKTTLLNVVSEFIPSDERILTIEDAAEIQLKQDHIVTLEARPPNIEGKGQITIRQLVINALRMRPDRILVGEVRGGEALDMLQAMNTGHDGSLTTAHSNGPRDTLRRLETMVMMAGMELPLRAIREQIASAIDLVVHVERLKDGSRRVVKVSEVQGMEGDVIVMQDIFVFEQMGIKDGKIMGRLRPTGLRPKFIGKIEAANIHLPPKVFGIEKMDLLW